MTLNRNAIFAHGDKSMLSPWLINMLISCVGIIVVGIISYGFHTGDRMNRMYSPLVDALMEIKQETTIAHLWFEEIMSGDRHEDIAMVWEHQDQAEWYAQAMLEGGENSEGTFIPLDDPQMRRKIEGVQEKLIEFRAITQKRLEMKALSGVGSDIDQHYDAVFRGFLEDVDAVETQLQQIMGNDLRVFKYTQLVLIVLTSLLFFSIGVAFHRFERSRVNSFRSLIRAKKNLETEVAERRLTEERLQTNEERLRTIFETLDNVAFTTTDLEGENTRILTFSTGAEKIFGYTAKEIIGQEVAILHLADTVKDFTMMQQSLRESSKGTMGETTLVRKSGEHFSALFTIHPLFDSAGMMNGTLGVTFDITERKQAEEELATYREHLEELVEERTEELLIKTEKIRKSEQALTYLVEDVNESREELQQVNSDYAAANTELKEFAYIVSHDLKAPLRAISQLTHWISEDYSEVFDADGRNQMDLILQRVKRMDGLIEGVLRYSRIGRVKEKEEQLDLDFLVREIIENISPPAGIQILIENKLPVVVRDPTRMGQLFQNLIENAIKYMDKDKGIIKVACVDKETGWEFSVSDNGPGIDRKYHDKIFQIFRTLSSRDEHESTGIGLTLVKKIITLYGGSIWVESEVGNGAAFFFTLPKKGDIDEKL